MRRKLSLAVGLAAAFALNVATPANAHYSSKRSQVTTPKAGMVKQRVRRSANNVSRAYGQAPYDAGDAYYGSAYGSAWSAPGPYYRGPNYGGPNYGGPNYGGPNYGGRYYGDAYYGGGAYYGDRGFAYHGYGQAPFESPGPVPRQSRMRVDANRDIGNTFSQPSTEAGATQARFESSASPAAPATRPAARQRTRANASSDTGSSQPSTEAGATQARFESSASPAAPATRPAARQRTRSSANDPGSAYGQAPSERSARPTSNREQSGQSGQCYISLDSSRGQGYYGDCSTKGAVQSK
jgi:hypothetical protein